MDLPNGSRGHKWIYEILKQHEEEIRKTDAYEYAKRYSQPELKVIFVRIMKLEGLTLHSYHYRNILAMITLMNYYWEYFIKYFDMNERLTRVQKIVRDGKEISFIVTFPPIHSDHDGEGLIFSKNNVVGLFPSNRRGQKHSFAEDRNELENALSRLSEPSPEEPSQPFSTTEEVPWDPLFGDFISC